MRAFFILITLALTLLACSGKRPTVNDVGSSGSSGSSRLTPRFSFEPPENGVPQVWDIEKVNVGCAAKSCPPQIGMLVFRLETSIQRCTATLIGPQEIVATGHCDNELSRGYFILGEGKKRQIRRLKSRLFKKFESDKPGTESLKAAGIVFELDSPVIGVQPLKLAQGPQKKFDKLTAYIVNDAEGSVERYKIYAAECTIHRHETIFPYDLDETPEIIWGFGCALKKGNSGGPMFAEGSADVQALVQGATSPEDFAALILREQKRAPKVFEKYWMVLATNVRCLDFPGSEAQTCTAYDDSEVGRRFSIIQQKALKQLLHRQPPREYRRAFNYKAYMYALKSEPDSYEALYVPICRQPDLGDFEAMNILSEYVRYALNEWGVPEIHGSDLRLTPAYVTNVQGERMSFEAKWAPPFGKLAQENAHPRRFWGDRFTIDLPVCAR
ncbi:MAG: hypothetical protein KF799_02780 [Bdellovibrionales bacterium]|nr:hypothetical protein [Bdellovibrionales bacterium]